MRIVPTTLSQFRQSRVQLGAGWRLAVLLSVVWGAAASFASSPSDSAAREKPYAVPAGPAGVALKLFARQAGVDLVFASRDVRSVRLNAVEGRFSSHEALERLLAGTGLVAVEDTRTGAVAIRPASSPTRLPAPFIEPPDADDGFAMNPFEVHVTGNTGYGALEANSLTAFRADLRSLPVTAEVFTRTFMDDLAATSIEEMLVNHAGTVGFNGSPINRSPGDRDGAGGINLRGMAIAGLKRDGFAGPRASIRSATGSTDNFSIERVEVLGGPQSLLHGGSGGGGVVNLVSKRAQFGVERGELRVSVDNYGSDRVLVDVNAGGERAAARVVATRHETKSARYNLGGRFDGLYAQLAFRLGPATTLRLWAERNDSDMNHAFKPRLDSFFAETDPRRGLDARLLALTGRTRDLDVVAGELDYGNAESLASWWASERIRNTFASVTLESALNSWLSFQLALIDGDTKDARIDPLRTLLPGGAAGNPFAVAAMQVVPTDNQQPHSVRGARATWVAEGQFFAGRLRSQTALGLEVTDHVDVDSIDYAYYLADTGWNVVVDPTKPTDYGRTQLGPQVFAVGYGIPRRPLFRPGTERVTIAGQNYVRQTRLKRDPRAVTDTNPLGLLPNNPGVGSGFAGNYAHGETRLRGVFVANLSEWYDGTLTTLAGVRFNQASAINIGSARVSRLPPWDETLTGNLGASYRVSPTLHAYGALSTSFTVRTAQTRDLAGESVQSIDASAPWPELGLKYHSADGRLSATLALNLATTQKNEAALVPPAFLDAVNPQGINGRHGSPDRWVNVDRTSSGVELKLSAQPTPRWRLRLSAAAVDGRVASTVRFNQFYNDQFHTDGAGTVTYRDGTPLRVDPTGEDGGGRVPLTLAMLNDPANPYFAAPDPDSGRITGVNALAALTRIDPVHGSAATGATGLAASQRQYAWSDPNGQGGVITVFREGEKTTGYNEINLGLQSRYTFDHGWLKGLGVFVDVRSYFRNRAYYAQLAPGPDGTLAAERRLYRLPDTTIGQLGLSYQRKLGPRLTWATQLNIDNVFDHSRVWILPSPTGGPDQARLSAQPRSVLWVNTLSF